MSPNHRGTMALEKNPRNFNGTFRSIPKHPKRYHLTLDMVDSEAEFLHRSSVQCALAFGTDLSVFNTCSGYGKCPTGCAHFVHRGNCRHPSVFYFKFQTSWATFLSIFCFFGVLGFPLFRVSVHVDDDRGI